MQVPVSGSSHAPDYPHAVHGALSVAV
jgi:hypothetical protein